MKTIMISDSRSDTAAVVLLGEREGPHVFRQKESAVLTCIGCVFLKSHLVKSGRQPQYEYLCKHPKTPAAVQLGRDEDLIAFEGYPVETPDWCPLVKGNLGKGTPIVPRQVEAEEL